VEIDEASLAERGQWPWPRTLLAELIRRVGAGGPAAIGLDMIFPERDRTSPPVAARELPGLPLELRRALAGLPDHDEALARAIARAPVVLARAALTVAPAQRSTAPPMAGLALRGGDPRPVLPRLAGTLGSLPPLEQAARGLGTNTLLPDADGRVRRTPLVLLADGRLWPALAVEVLRIASGGRGVVLGRNAAGMESVLVAGRRLQTDESGRVWIRFAEDAARPVVSARSVLADEVDPSLFAGRIVLIGATALGLGDVKATPLAALPGIHVHAQLIEALRDGRVLVRPGWALGLELVLILAAGLLVVWLAPRLGPGQTLALGALVLAGVTAGSWLAFALGDLLIDFGLAALTGFVAWSAMVYLHYRREDQERRRTDESLALMRREMQLAGDMQRAILPQRQDGLAGVELHATMLPALDIGGDFYDWFRLPSGQIALVVADVSGKGMAAALFMAIARTVLRASAAAEAGDCGACLARANDLLAADNEAAMFVTMVYAVLDPRTGELAYANGGHNPPCLVSGDGRLRWLPATGGMALGMLGGVAFGTGHVRLAPDDMLVLYTDGVTEAFSRRGEPFGEARLERSLRDGSALPPSEAVTRLVADVQAFVRGAEPSDDITCLALRLTPDG
ncbi:MAG TPA: CHASE2 domain-containing protein, partial [Geminicoccaceae bacterium]|nr:CHASE2 domain-containing protein [Geminicoccaceae bacterium]